MRCAADGRWQRRVVNDGILNCTVFSSIIMDGHLFGGLSDVAWLRVRRQARVRSTNDQRTAR